MKIWLKTDFNNIFMLQLLSGFIDILNFEVLKRVILSFKTRHFNAKLNMSNIVNVMYSKHFINH